MADPQVPVPAAGAVPIDSATAVDSGEWGARFAAFIGQPAFRRAMPALVVVSVIAVLAALYLMMASGPQRILYSDLTDGERAEVVNTLERGGISYIIDNGTGAVTVAEDDIYRARMLVASDAGLAAPEGASEMLDAIPMGSSRTLEGERLRLARERELMLTIREIDGIETVRVHLATPERSVFVRNNNPPSASVMVRLVSGRSLGQAQVEAIVNLVSGSVPGMTSDAVRVVDQNGRLLSSPREDRLDGLILQREFEAKLREQLASLLTPLLGDGNFSTQIQAELDQSEMTAARETYDQDGVVRSEREQTSMRLANPGVGGVPGVPANTPPPDAELVDGAPDPEGDAQASAGGGALATAEPTDSESSFSRNYELGRAVEVTSTRAGGVVKLSVAVAVSDSALESAAPLTLEEWQSLVSAAVGADADRGDQVQVVASAFETTELPEIAFYEQSWFAKVLRYVSALIAVLLVLFLAVRPLISRFREPGSKPQKANGNEGADGELAKGETAAQVQGAREGGVLVESGKPPPPLAKTTLAAAQEAQQADFPKKVELVRQLASAQPDRAVEALQRMLENPLETSQEAPAQ